MATQSPFRNIRLDVSRDPKNSNTVVPTKQGALGLKYMGAGLEAEVGCNIHRGREGNKDLTGWGCWCRWSEG